MNYSILHPPHRWVNPDGQLTPEAYKFMVNLFHSAGSGQSPTLDVVAVSALSQIRSDGEDVHRRTSDLEAISLQSPQVSGRIAALESSIADVKSMVFQSSQVAGRISALEKRISDLEALNMQLLTRVDLNPMKNQVDVLTALMASH